MQRNPITQMLSNLLHAFLFWLGCTCTHVCKDLVSKGPGVLGLKNLKDSGKYV